MSPDKPQQQRLEHQAEPNSITHQSQNRLCAEAYDFTSSSYDRSSNFNPFQPQAGRSSVSDLFGGQSEQMILPQLFIMGESNTQLDFTVQRQMLDASSLDGGLAAIKASGDKEALRDYFRQQMHECLNTTDTHSGNQGEAAQLIAQNRMEAKPAQTKDLDQETINAIPGHEKWGKVSEKFKHDAVEWWKSLPEETREKIKASHIDVLLVNKAADADKNVANQQARRHPGETVSMLPGFYDPNIHALVMVEHPDQSPSQGNAHKHHEQGHVQDYGAITPFDTDVATHELGHALDYQAAKHMSQSSEFDAAFHEGLKIPHPDLSPYQRYLLQSDEGSNPPTYKAAKEELMAELFRIAHTKNPSQADRNLMKDFPKAYEMVQKI